MRRISLVNLETICWIERLGTFEAAALRLNTSQPTISARVKELESSVGVPLFSRSGRRMELTIQGRALVARAEYLLKGLDELVVALDSPFALVGVVRLAMVELVALTWGPAFISQLKRLMPNVVYEVDVDLTANVKSRLAAGTVDAGIALGPLDIDANRVASVGSVEVAWLASKQVMDAFDDSVPLAAIFAKVPLFTLPRQAITHRIALEAIREWKLQPVDLNTCSNQSLLTAVICNGAGIGLIPEPLVRAQLERGEIRRVSSLLQDHTLNYQIAWHEDQNSVLMANIVNAALQATTFDSPRDSVGVIEPS